MQKPFRIPIPWKGTIRFFLKLNYQKLEIKIKDIVSDIIDEEFRYQWIGHH